MRRGGEGARSRALALTAALALGAGCAGSSPTPVGSPMEPLPQRGARVPDAPDRAAHDVAAAALAGDRPAAERALARARRLEGERAEAERRPTGVLPHAIDARNALLPEEEWRRAARALLERDDVDPGLRERLEAELADEPLALADERMDDALWLEIGGIANAVLEPIGRAALGGPLLPLRAVQSATRVALTLHRRDPLNLPERQALEHWKRYVERNPESPRARELLERIESAQREWFETRHDEALRDARRALEQDDAPRAVALASRALRYSPEDPEAAELRAEARRRLERWRADRRRSLGAAEELAVPPGAQRALAVALLRPGGEPAGPARALRDEAGEGALADEAEFVLAGVDDAAGEEEDAWERLEALAEAPPERSNMSRHARALVRSSRANPWRAFGEARAHARSERLEWLLFGPLQDGARDRDLPRPVEWLVEVPSLLAVVGGLPGRLLRFPFQNPPRRGAAALARRYLERRPAGAHAPEARRWLQDFEEDRGNYVGALEVAKERGDVGEERMDELRRKAAEQALAAARDEERRDVRVALLRDVARRFRGTDAGQRAGELAREEIEEATPQRIRLSRSFLRENPHVAGPDGLALRPGLLDEELSNGEIHEEGIAFLGGRTLEFAFVAPSGDESDPPERRRRTVSEERLARIAALLQETQLRQALLDPDVTLESDPARDLFLERARFGVTGTPDTRPTAQSEYVFRGVRERYGIVRGRENVLPVELVVQGSFEDLGLGAFPRVKKPRPTPDALLYR